MALTPRERGILELADQPYRYEAIREDRIRSVHRLTPAAFWQQVNTILDRSDALEADAQLVRRLLRKRDRRAAARAGSAVWPAAVHTVHTDSPRTASQDPARTA